MKDFVPEKVLEAKEARRMDRFTQFAIVASLEAMADAKLAVGDTDPERFGIILGNGIGGIETLETQCRRIIEKGPKSVHPLFVPMMIANEAPGNVAIRLQAFGPCRCVVTACASSNDAMGDAWRLIRDGTTDVMLAGGTEAPLTPPGLLGVLLSCRLSARGTTSPTHASRPFDKDRDGFVMAEGAGILVLEELEHARKRGARILAEIAGYGATCDANHLTAPHPEGRGAIKAMQALPWSRGTLPLRTSTTSTPTGPRRRSTIPSRRGPSRPSSGTTRQS